VIPHNPQVESLNAGVAGSIVLYEAARQRRWVLPRRHRETKRQTRADESRSL